MLRSVIGASVRFRFLLIAFTAAGIALAVVMLPGMHSDVLPETAPVTVRIQTEAPGLSAPEVESLVTVPLEKNLLEGVMGVADVTSDSIPGLSQIVLDFASGTSLYQARQLVQERLTQAFVLPNVSRPPVMLQPVSSTGNVMLIGLTSRELSLIDLSVLARWTIVPRLLGVPGVADVAAFGEADRQLQVLVNPTRLAARHITLAQIIETAGNAQLVSPLSFLEGSTPGTGGFLEGPNQRMTIQPVLPFGTPANLAQVPVAETSGRQPVPLGSVTDIVVGHQPLIGDALVRGQPGLVLVVEKLPSASVPAVTDGLDQALTQLRPALSGVQVSTSLFRPASYTGAAQHNLIVALIAAAAGAALALVLLLSLRLAAIALIAMGTSLLAGIMALYLLGYTFNALVALGLLLALAVVAAEGAGTARRLMTRMRSAARDGTRPSGASLAIEACNELRGPLCAATLAVLAGAAPLAFASGVTGAFLRPMVLAFALTVAASMVVALTVTPALAAVLLGGDRRPVPGRGRGRAHPASRPAREVTGQAYRAALGRALRMPRWAMAGLGLAGLGALAALPAMHPGQPQFQDRNLVIRWTGAPGMSLPELDRLAERTSSELAALPAVGDVAATVGRAVSSDQIVNTNSAEIWVTIKPGAPYASAVGQVRAIAGGMPGVAGTVSTYESDSMGGVLAPAPSVLTVRLYGSGYGQLARLGRQAEAVMSRTSGLGPPQMQLPVDQPTLNLAVNLGAATRNGVKPGDIRREAATLLSGLTVGNFFEQQKVFDVVVMGTPALGHSLTGVNDLLLDTVNGGHARLGSLARVSVASEPADIKHDAMSPYVDVTARLSGRGLGPAMRAVADGLGRVAFPLGYSAVVVGRPASPAVSWERLAGYVLAALIGVLLLAQAATGSWRLALLVLTALPVPVAAGVLTAFALGAQDSLAAMTGLLGVLAIAIYQAFRVTATIRRAHPGGRGPLTQDRLVAAAADASGPVITAATVGAAALVPFIAMGDTAGTELLHTAAAVILAGLVAATLLNTIVLPVACLRFGRVQDVAAGPDQDLAEAHTVPFPREEQAGTGVPRPATEPGHPVLLREGALVHRFIRRAGRPVIAAAAVLAVLAGCGGGTSAPDEPPTARMANAGPHGALSVVLTPVGLQRIGLRTAVAAPAGRDRAVVPYSALLYQSDGSTVIYTVTGPLTYTLVTVGVASIQGSQVYLTGLAPGATVVTVGGEELLGVQDGVGAQT
jgi:Cu/Ag efflux pump CusA